MADEGIDFGYCDECGKFCQTNEHPQGYYIDNVMYCADHVPLVMDKEAMDMVFAKAGVPGPKRHRPFESILGILFFSKKHHAQAAEELRRVDN